MASVSGGIEARVGQNEALFRELNERIAAGQWPATGDDPVAFRCECAMLGCNILVELRLGEYEAVRADARQFVVAPGHELPDVEIVVRREPGYVVVAKLGEAADVAKAEDPRSP
jgi:hypothetical protein